MKLIISKQTVTLPLVFIAVFYGTAFALFFAKGDPFFLFNFMYIGTTLAAGFFLTGALPAEKKDTGRKLTQLFVGLYLLCYVGIFLKEDLQIEGFWFYLFSGVFAGATIHYFVAKIAGPFIFGRGWCGWACWSAMVFDLLPWKEPAGGKRKPFGFFRYIHCVGIAAVAAFLYFGTTFGKTFYENPHLELRWLLAGNAVYYLTGIMLAAILKDNRAFCKYVCPVPVFQKAGTACSLLKITIDPEKCIGCKKCERSCPMQVPILTYKTGNMRVGSTECIACLKCTHVCSRNALSYAFKAKSKSGRSV